DQLAAEAASDAPGAEAVVCRLADVLLLQVLRRELAGAGDARLAALQDAQIARAVELMHGQPERDWSLSALARSVALSRSAFAGRFRALVREPPDRYLTRGPLAP